MVEAHEWVPHLEPGGRAWNHFSIPAIYCNALQMLPVVCMCVESILQERGGVCVRVRDPCAAISKWSEQNTQAWWKVVEKCLKSGCFQFFPSESLQLKVRKSQPLLGPGKQPEALIYRSPWRVITQQFPEVCLKTVPWKRTTKAQWKTAIRKKLPIK